MLRALSVKTTRRAISRSIVDFPAVRKANHKVIKDLAEFKQRDIFHQQLKAAAAGAHDKPKLDASEISLKPDDIRLVLKASLATFLLHVEGRIAASVGQGFYTIGPCGEELLSIVGLSLHATDPSALHYRHVGTAVMRALRSGKSLDEVVLDRARGYTVSSLDPVTGGRHCAIGGSSYDFFVSSTLSSQCCPAVGRAQAIPLAHTLKVPSPFPKDAVSYVSLGDGSANNGHFLSALNLAEYSIYHKIKCPVVFAISDNGISISLKDKGWLQEMVNRVAMKRFTADGSDPLDVHAKSEAAIHYSRTYRRPSLLVFKNLSRRFGHASTDRQSAYLSQNDIEGAASRNDLHEFCKLAVESGAISWSEILTEFENTANTVEKAFDAAANEPKITSREDLIQSNSAPIVSAPVAAGQVPKLFDYSNHREQHAHGKGKVVAEVMRKHMTALFDEALSGQSPAGDHVVYLGEDVRHGGYYLVTDGLAAKYPLRVHDFPPDETALVGAAWGYAQAGLRPVLEIPYAKYLDCASDMFHEICATHWLTNGREAPGLLIRLQGFDKGTFGGNFHTHNSLHIPPGLDVVCYSNGLDYVRGARHLLRQTGQGGRVCMSVDCTELLNRRHLYPELQDGFFLSQFPTAQGDSVAQEMTFEDVVLYQPNDSKARCGAIAKDKVDLSKVSLVIVSYGNGLPTSLITMNNLIEKGALKAEEVLVVDSPYLTRPPKELEVLLTELQQAHHGHGRKQAPAVVFADICKEGPAMPFASFVVSLQKSGVLPAHWRAVGGSPTYNPLGQLLTFLSTDDIEQAATAALQSGRKK